MEKGRNAGFPSYRAIEKRVEAKLQKAQKDEIVRLQGRLSDLEARHASMGAHHSSSPFVEEALEAEEAVKVYHSGATELPENESLNFYLEDDKDVEDNFERQLKFKKRMLERELWKEPPEERAAGDADDALFKQLYAGKGQEERLRQIEQNQKTLLENYSKVLKKLEDAHIIKWRILNRRQR